MSLTRYTCAINGQGLQDIDPTIFITDIQESAPKIKTQTVSNAIHDGLRLTRVQRQSLSVSVTFCIREYDTERRKAIADKVCEWAQDGWLTIGDRMWQRLLVTCDRLPVITSALKWTDHLTVGFTAYALPYWQAMFPATVTFSGTNGVVSITPDGTADCFLEAEVKAEAGTVDIVGLSANGRFISFNGLGLTQGKTLSIGYDDANHLQYMRIGDTPVFSKRIRESADDLILHPKRPNSIGLEASGRSTFIIRARGLWR